MGYFTRAQKTAAPSNANLLDLMQINMKMPLWLYGAVTAKTFRAVAYCCLLGAVMRD
jgi:hypothetical protein